MHKYPKLRQLGHGETEGILDGPVEITEKLDGANCRFTTVDGQLFVGSRNNHVPVGEPFMEGLGTWASDYQIDLEDALRILNNEFNGDIVIVGDWMRKHTVNYGITEPYVVFYDVFVSHVTPDGEERVVFLSEEDRRFALDVLDQCGFNTNRPIFHGIVTVKDIQELYMDRVSQLNENTIMEGIVLKRHDFENKYGRQCHAKVLNESFLERKDTGSKPNRQKMSREDYSVIVETFVTPMRIKKLCEANDLPVEVQSMSKLCKLVSEDILTEEIVQIRQWCDVLNFKEFENQVNRATVKILNAPRNT